MPDDPLEMELPSSLRRTQMTLGFLLASMQPGTACTTRMIEMLRTATKELDQLTPQAEMYFQKVQEDRRDRRFASIKGFGSRIRRKHRKR